MERRILVFAPSGQDAVLTEKLFRAVDISVGICRSEYELAAMLGEGAGALMVAEEALTSAALGLLRRYVEQQPAWSNLPVLLLTRHGADSPEVQRAVEQLGNVTLLERPVRTVALISAARSALRARERQFQMRALNQRKDEFLATLAHELRNPLAPIVNAASIFERLHPSAQTTRLVGMVNRQISHLTRLIDDLMDVARITSGKIELQLGPTSVDAVVTSALELAGGAIAERGHALEVHRPGRPVALHADQVRLVQSLANVLVNAAKYTPRNGRVTLWAEVQGPDVTFRVRDNGKGLAPEALGSIFGMFAQGRSAGEPSTGLGMGLHLAKVFAEMHSGTITAESAGPGCGSEFAIRLPVVVHRDDTQAPEGAAEPDMRALPQRVLVVDDNEDAANTLQALLSLRGIEAGVAHDGVAAVAMARETQPDVIVMDIGMPHMNGYEAARRIRAQSEGPGPMLIALTGWGQYADRVMAEEAGFDHHFVKPLDLQRLLSCLSGASARSGTLPDYPTISRQPPPHASLMPRG